MSSFDAGQEDTDPSTVATTTGLSTPVKVRELEEATEKGLLVDLALGEDMDSPTSLVLGSVPQEDTEMDEGDNDDDNLL